MTKKGNLLKWLHLCLFAFRLCCYVITQQLKNDYKQKPSRIIENPVTYQVKKTCFVILNDVAERKIICPLNCALHLC